MLSTIFFTAFAGGLLSYIVPAEKRWLKTILPLGVMVCLCIFANRHYGSNEVFMLPWINLPKLTLAFNFSSTPLLWQNSLYPLAMTAVLIGNNLFFKSDKKAEKQNALLLLNLAAVIFLFSAQNLMQFLIAVEAISLCSVRMAWEAEERKRYISQLLLSDLALMAAFALIYRQSGGMDIQNPAMLAKKLHSPILVSSLLLFSILAKSGLFFFHTGLFELRDISLNRLAALLFVTVPFCSLVMTAKLYPMLVVFPSFDICLKVLCWSSLILGGCGLFIKDSLKEIGLCLYIAAAGILFMLLSETVSSGISVLLIKVLLIFYLLIQTVIGVSIVVSNETYISKMGGIAEHLKIYFLVSLLGVAAFISQFLFMFSSLSKSFCSVAFVMILAGIAHVFHRIYLPPVRTSEHVAAFLKNPPLWYIFSLTCMAVEILYNNSPFSQTASMIFIAFLLWLILSPLRFFYTLAGWEGIQEKDYLSTVYDMIFVAPLRLLGRVLWLTVDFVFIERTVLASVRHLYELLQSFFQRMEYPSLWRYILLAAAGFAFCIYLTGGYL